MFGSTDKKGKPTTDTFKTNLVDVFARAFSEYEINRGSIGVAYDAQELIRAYDLAKTNVAIKKTEAFWKEFKRLSEENPKLKTQIEQLTKEKDGKIDDLVKERDGFRKRWEDCETNKQRGNTETSTVEKS